MNYGETANTFFLNTTKEQREIFSELDTLLRALDRFFYIENIPISTEDISNKDFHEELKAVRDVIFRILGILEVVIPESRKNAYWFQKFTESKFLSDHSRDMFKEKLYKQDSPEKGIFLLYDLFINMKSIITDLLKTSKISFLSYTNMGQLISREIRENIFFNPFRKDINPVYDTLGIPVISDIVKSIDDRKLRNIISLNLIYLFRFLRFLRYVDITSHHSVALNSSLLILIMMKSELKRFIAYVRSSGDKTGEDIFPVLDSISFQFSMETKRVYLQELKEIMRNKAPQQFRGRIENSYGILKNLIEESIVQIVHFFRPDIQGEDIFDSFTTRIHQSMKLRDDIFVLLQFLRFFEEKAAAPGDAQPLFESLKNFMRYFESLTFKMLRYSDYEEFNSFFTMIFSMKRLDTHKILEKIHNFNIFLETTLRHISNRAELKGRALDTAGAENIIKQYF